MNDGVKTLAMTLMVVHGDVSHEDALTIAAMIHDPWLVAENLCEPRMTTVDIEDTYIHAEFTNKIHRDRGRGERLIHNKMTEHEVVLGPAWYDGGDPDTTTWDGRCLACGWESTGYFTPEDKDLYQKYIEQAKIHVRSKAREGRTQAMEYEQ